MQFNLVIKPFLVGSEGPSRIRVPQRYIHRFIWVSGFVLLPRHWVLERSFAWAARFRRLARDYERQPEKLAGLHFVAFACLLLARIAFQFHSG